MTSIQTNKETLFVESSTQRDPDGSLVPAQLVMERCADCGQVTQFALKQVDLLAAAPQPITREYACHCDSGRRLRQLAVSYLPGTQRVEVVQFISRRRALTLAVRRESSRANQEP